MKHYLLASRGLLLPIALLLLWQYQSGQGAVQAYAFVPLQNLGVSLVELINSGELWLNTEGSLTRLGLGLLIGISLGVATGVLMALSPWAQTLISPLYHGLRQVPLLGLAPLIGMFLGNGQEAKVFIIALAAFFPMVLNTFDGLRATDISYRELAAVLKLNRLTFLQKVLLPSAMPSIITGLLLAIPFAWITCIGGELLFNAGAGLGNLMMAAEMAAKMDVILVCTLLVTLLGISMNAAVNRLGMYLLRWRKRAI